MAAEMTDRVCVITGASRGIGKASAEAPRESGRQPCTGLPATGRRGQGRQGDQPSRRSSVPGGGGRPSSQNEVRRAAALIGDRHPQIHVLINNAGVFTRRRELTADGLEQQFAVNHLAYFLLTNLLLDRLKEAVPSRIINVSSGAHGGSHLDFADLQGERGYDGNQAYSRTKLANILFTYELARRLMGSGVTANCLHPGVIATRLLADYMGATVAGSAPARTFGAKPEKGAETIVYLASSPEVDGVTGKYFVNKRSVTSSRESYDEAAARRLWEISERLTGLSN